ncbi:hypothetical protein B484DRAFT_29126 [Ochromonadaceae sp. CCMP2298]|nr:hypothetical protein B484DRAFT_29126 [Ochromonadaceae sp. CCMP2298]
MMLSQTFYRKLDRPSTGKAKAAEVGDSAGVGAGEGGAGVGGAVAGAEAVAGAVMETETEEAGEGEGDREGEREFVKEFLLEHPVWRDGNYWEQALWQCAIEQLQSIPCPCPWYDMDWDERKQAVRRVHEVLFSQVMAITHSMLELGCSQEQTREFLYRMCVIHQLSESMRQHLLKHVNKNKGLGRGRDGGRRGSGDGDRRGSGDGDRRGSGDGDGRRSSGGGDRRGSGLGSGGSKGSGGSGSGGGGGDGIWSDSDALDVVM